MPRHNPSDMTPAEFAITRERLGLTFQEIAAALGVDKRTPQRWTAPGRPPEEASAAALRTMLAARQHQITQTVRRLKDTDTGPVDLVRWDTPEQLHEHAPDFPTIRSHDAHLAALTAALDAAEIAYRIVPAPDGEK